MIRLDSLESLIRELNATDETEELEAKEISGKEIGRSVYETICALSNEPDLEGGTILLGIRKEQGLFPFYEVSGIKDPERISSAIASTCATIFNQPVRVDIRPIRIDKKIVLKIDVPEVPKTQKPVYFAATGLPKGAYRRIGPADVRCTDEDIAAFYQGGSSDPFDARIVRDAKWSDIDPDAIAMYRKSRSSANPLAEELNWTDEEILYALGGIRRIDGTIKITNTGLLTFGKSTSIRRIFPANRVDYIRVPGKTWVQDPEAKFDSIDMRGPILTLVGRVIAAISDDLPKSFLIDESKSGQRTETPVVPFRVIREAVVNALMHRSYQFHQPVQVVRFSNRIVIKNAGYSLKSPDRFDDPGSSIRNPNIAAILHETQFAETKGSGIRIMQTQMKQRGLASPTFESNRDTDEFVATFLFHHFLDAHDLDWLSKFTTFELSEDQMKALIFVREVGAIDNATYRSLTTTDTLAASKSLRTLRKLDILADRGSGAKTHYVAGPEMAKREADSRTHGVGRGPIHGKAAIMDAAIHDNEIQLEDMPIPLRVVVRNAHLTKRLSPDEGKRIILTLCAWRPLSLQQLSGLMNKTPTHISQNYTSPLVAEGSLEYLYPEMIQHPRQKYKTVQSGSTPKKR